jgi:hypothetical protein
MAWVWLDDEMPEHPKVVGAAGVVGDSALAAAVSGIAYSNRHLTDGHLPAAKVQGLTHHKRPAVVAQALVTAGLWEPVDGGYLIHDFGDYQTLKAELEEKRARGAAKVRRHRDNKRSNPEVTPPVTGYTPRYNPSPPAGAIGGQWVEGVVVAVEQPEAGVERDRDIDTALAILGVEPEAVRLRDTVEILRQSRLFIDPELVGVANILAAHPGEDHKAAAQRAVADAADPAYKTTNASRALDYAFQRGRSRTQPLTAVKPATPSRYGRGRPHNLGDADVA